MGGGFVPDDLYDEVREAWTATYTLLANTMIEAQREAGVPA